MGLEAFTALEWPSWDVKPALGAPYLMLTGWGLESLYMLLGYLTVCYFYFVCLVIILNQGRYNLSDQPQCIAA